MPITRTEVFSSIDYSGSKKRPLEASFAAYGVANPSPELRNPPFSE
jgi:hypothetical protein